jgi:hypothetical protein
MQAEYVGTDCVYLGALYPKCSGFPDWQALKNKSTYDPDFDFDVVPNLVGRLKIIKGSVLAGGFCDIYSGELTSKQGIEPVAINLFPFSTTKSMC